MSSTLTPTCSFCGLRFENRPILELHIREDHAQHLSSREDHPRHRSSAAPGHGTPAGAPAPRPHLRSPAGEDPAPATASRTEATEAGASTAGSRRPRAGWARVSLRRVIGAFRRANAEFQLASEIMLRPGGVPRPRQPADAPAEPDDRQAARDGKTDRAA